MISQQRNTVDVPLLMAKPVMQRQTHLVLPAWGKSLTDCGLPLDATDYSGGNTYLRCFNNMSLALLCSLFGINTTKALRCRSTNEFHCDQSNLLRLCRPLVAANIRNRISCTEGRRALNVVGCLALFE